MGKLVKPQTFLIGYSGIDMEGLKSYLQYTGNLDFLESINKAVDQGLSDGEILASLYAKICYASLTLGKNSNVTRVRDIPDNLIACFTAGHGSVFGHAQLNLITTNCSRVFTHELVRNHIGTEFSQTSGRYCRLDIINLIFDNILDGCQDIVYEVLKKTEDSIYLMECRKGLRKPPSLDPAYYQVSAVGEFYLTPEATLIYREEHGEELWNKVKWVPDNTFDFNTRKKITSAIRRIAPNGQSNEIGWSINLRALRHVIQMRTSRHAEWEIRLVMGQVYDLVRAKFPMIFHGARVKYYDDLPEVSNLRTQPYTLSDEEVLRSVSIADLHAEVERRR